MDAVFGQKDSQTTAPAMVARVLNDARRTFGEGVEGSFLERCVQDAVEGLWQDSIKVRTFVPVLALRQVRDVIEARDGTYAGSTP